MNDKWRIRKDRKKTVEFNRGTVLRVTEGIEDIPYSGRDVNHALPNQESRVNLFCGKLCYFVLYLSVAWNWRLCIRRAGVSLLRYAIYRTSQKILENRCETRFFTAFGTACLQVAAATASRNINVTLFTPYSMQNKICSWCMFVRYINYKLDNRSTPEWQQ